MRIRDGKDLSKVYHADFPYRIYNLDISCQELLEIKNSIKGFMNPTEPIILKLLWNYLTLNKFGERDNIKLFWGPVYRGIAGNNQEIDISIEQNGKIKFGISVKSQFGGG